MTTDLLCTLNTFSGRHVFFLSLSAVTKGKYAILSPFGFLITRALFKKKSVFYSHEINNPFMIFEAYK